MACKTVQFKKGGRKTVRFCAKTLSPAKRAAKARRGRMILKKFACKSRKLSPALKKACRSLRA